MKARRDMAIRELNVFEQADELYERYGKPLEGEHWGKYVAVSYDGRTLLGTDLHTTHREGRKSFGEEMHVFHVGEKFIKLPPPKRLKGKEKRLSWRLSIPIIRLYERYGKPLEAEHQGKFVAITSDGRTMLGTNKDILFNKAIEALGSDIFVFEVGRPRRNE